MYILISDLNACEETKHRDFISKVQDESLLHGGGVSKVGRAACSILYAWLGVERGVWFRMGALVAQRVKNLPAMWETWVRSLGWEDPLEKEMATHSSILA